MKSTLTLFFAALAVFAFGQNPWKAISETSIIAKHSGERLTIPEKYHTYELDFDKMTKVLAKAPLTSFGDKTAKKAQMALPMADGSIEIFEFVESPAMSPVLSAKYPNIRSFKGMSTTDRRNTAWIDFSPEGFRGAINSAWGVMYIDPYYAPATDSYITYFVADHKIDVSGFEKTCGVEHYTEQLEKNTKLLTSKEIRPKTNRRSMGMPVVKHTYRAAIACTGAWGSQQGSTVDQVLAKMNSAANRLNSFFEPELAMKLELVDNNDKIIFFRDTEPYTSPNLGGMTLSENTDIINSYIGASSYDVGHVFTISCTDGVAGIANLGCVCVPCKGNGVSCVGNNNLNNFMTSTTAHELGHQFTAGHTWNNCPPSEDQFAFASNCEPGSGSTIMSYMGLCGADNNISGEEHPYYHVCSLEQIYSFINNPGGAGSCGTHIESDNSVPEVWIDQESGFYIPISTPFELTGDAMDMDGDDLLYNWDQTDRGFSFPLGSPDGNSASFRSLKPGVRKTRIFPKLRDVLSGKDNKEERLPTYSRDLSFAFTARDGHPEAGGVAWDYIEFKATDTAGPFRVTSPSQFTTTNVGQYLDVEWNVADTDNDLVNCQYVDIYFSTDGGLSFPHTLAVKTPNDGSEQVRIPNALTDDGKIKVKGHGNVFFNISRNTIRVEEPTVAGFYMTPNESLFDFCLPNSAEVTFNGSTYLGFSEMVTFDVVSGLPTTATATFSETTIPAEGTTTLVIDMADVLYSENYQVLVRAIGGVDTVYQTISINATGTYFDDVVLTSPANATRGLASVPDFAWNGNSNAASYTLQVATSPTFDISTIVIDKNVGQETTGSELINLDNSTVYYWRLVMDNRCSGLVYSDISTFSSNALNCRTFIGDDVPLNIPSNGTPTVETTIDVTEQGELSDLNVDLIKGNHTDLKTLRGTIISPAGTAVVLWQGQCLNTGDINAGFDTDSAFDYGCPDRNGEKIKPLEDLSVYNGESIEGKWKLKIEDVGVGNGGTITDFQLELCSTSALFSPYIVNNEVLEVAVGKKLDISTSSLLSEDDNNTATELVYTIVKAPTKGSLLRNAIPLSTGSQFKQNMINNGQLIYSHDGTEEETDSFTFIVEDGEGGWIEQTEFIINASENGLSSTKEIESAEAYFNIYPNPAIDVININQIVADNSTWNLELIDAAGQRVASSTFSINSKLNVATYDAGLYFINLSNGEKTLSQKLSIIK